MIHAIVRVLILTCVSNVLLVSAYIDHYGDVSCITRSLVLGESFLVWEIEQYNHENSQWPCTKIVIIETGTIPTNQKFNIKPN